MRFHPYVRPLACALLALLLSIGLLPGTLAPAPVQAARLHTSAHAYQPLGYWNHVCVLRVRYLDMTITLGSDDGWADYQCGYMPAASNGILYPIPQDPALRPGTIQCAFIQRYWGQWQALYPDAYGNYMTNEGTGQSQIAVRAANDTITAGGECASLYGWVNQQNVMNGFASTSGGGGGGGGGGCGNCGTGGGGGGGGGVVKPKPHKAQKPAPVCTKQHHPKGCRKPKPGIKA